MGTRIAQAYGVGNALIPVFPIPIIALRDPVNNQDTLYPQGQKWFNNATSPSTDWEYLGFGLWIQITGGGGSLSTLTPDVGGAVTSVANNINVQGGASGAIIFSNGGAGQMDAQVQVDGATITINGSNQLAAADQVRGTATTVGAVTVAAITFPLGAVPAVYTFEGRIAGFNVTDNAGGGYFFIGAVRTTGAAGVEILSEVTDELEEAAMMAADITFVVVGNTVEVRVSGIAAKTIRWSAEMQYEFVV